MATAKVAGRLWVLQLDINNDATFTTIVCATSNVMSFTTDTIDTSSKCGDEETLNKQKATASGDFFVGQTPTTGQESLAAVFTAWKAKTDPIAFKFGEASPTTGDIVYSGNCKISEITITADDQDSVKFSMSLIIDITGLTQTVTA